MFPYKNLESIIEHGDNSIINFNQPQDFNFLMESPKYSHNSQNQENNLDRKFD